MAYIPPHKRHMKDEERPPPSPALLVPKFEKSLHLRSSSSNSERMKDKHFPSGSNSDRRKDKHFPSGGKIIYARDSVSRLHIAGLIDDDNFGSSVQMEPISLESFEQRHGGKPLVFGVNQQAKESSDPLGSFWKSPWTSVAESIQQDLLTSFQNVRSELEAQNCEEVKPSFVARFGKILFHGSPPISLGSLSKSSDAETTLSQVKRSFYTNVSSSYVETILCEVTPKIGFDFDEEKEIYHVKVSDNMRPDATISCKCSVTNGGRELELYKIELNTVRHLVVDVSCLAKNLDLRLMLSTKRVLTKQPEDEKQSIINLVKSAVIDPDVKGGLRWALGKESFGDRFNICGVWHTKAKAFRSKSMRLTIRNADRFDFRTSTGEVTREVTLRMKGIAGQLRDQMVEISLVSKMLEDILKMIWDHFLSCDCPLS